MTTLPNCIVPAHQEDIGNGHFISWPAYTVTGVVGGHVLMYRGTQGFDAGQQYVTINSSDGNQMLRFGGYWNGLYDGASGFGLGGPTSGSYRLPNGQTRYYNGPYTVVLPGEFDEEDDMFRDVEIFTTLDYVWDNFTGKIPDHPRSGPIAVHGGHVVDDAIGSRHLTQSHVSQGMFTGGAMQCVGGATSAVHLLWILNQNDALYFQTKDGSGDQSTPGKYRISGATQYLNPPQTPVMIGGYGNPNMSVQFPPPGTGAGSTGADNAQLAFCCEFPGSASAATVNGAGTGSLQAGQSYFLRFCLYRNVTISGYTQTIETPLSQFTEADMPSDGLNTHSFTVTLPSIPTDPTMPSDWGQWTGMRIYMTAGSQGYDNQFQLLASGTDYTLSGSTLTVKNLPSQRGGSEVQPSYGFSAWPSYCDFVSVDWFDKTFMSVGYISGQIDNTTNNYTIGSNVGAISQIGPQHVPDASLNQKKLVTTNTVPSGASSSNPSSLMSDGQNLFWGNPTGASGSGGSSIANGGMTLEVDSNGNLVSVGGAATRLSTNPFGGNAVNSGIVGYGSNQSRGYIQLTLNTSLGQIGGMYALCTVVFVYPYSGTPFVLLQNLSSGHVGQYSYSQAGIAVSTSTNGFTVYNTVPFNPQTTGAELYFYYFVLG